LAFFIFSWQPGGIGKRIGNILKALAELYLFRKSSQEKRLRVAVKIKCDALIEESYFVSFQIAFDGMLLIR